MNEPALREDDTPLNWSCSGNPAFHDSISDSSLYNCSSVVKVNPDGLHEE